LMLVAHTAADDRRVAGSHADASGRTLDIAGMHDGFAAPDDHVATAHVRVADQHEHFAKPGEHVADATEPSRPIRATARLERAPENPEAPTTQQLARSMRFLTRVRPSVGRRAGAVSSTRRAAPDHRAACRRIGGRYEPHHP